MSDKTCCPANDAGSSIVEFVFLGILVLLPLMYLVVTVSTFQRSSYAVTQAARQAGRALATAPDITSAATRARYAAQLAMGDQGLSDKDVVLRFGGTGPHCAGGSDQLPTFAPDDVMAVCVTRSVMLPGIPGFFTGKRNTVTGRFIVHFDKYRGYLSRPH